MHRKRLLPLAVAVFCLISPAAHAVPLPIGNGEFGIAPARRHVVGHPGIALSPTTVFNGTSSSYQVSVFPAILTQDLTGAFDFSATPLNLNDSKLVLTAAPDRFAMSPGGVHQVNLQWNLLPRGHKWIAIGVVFQGVAEGQGGPVRVVSRLLSVNFLSLPGLTHVSGAFTGLYGQQVARHVLEFVARVKNTGDTFSGPSAGRLMIRDASGRAVFSEPWTGDVILPGAQRNFPILVRKLLPAGPYTATVQMQFGGERSRSTTFTLVGPNQLPTPAVAIRGFNATGVVGSPAHLTARIISDGTAPATLTLRLFLASAHDASPGASALAAAELSYRRLAPGSVTELSRALGHSLRGGVYRAFITWTDPAGGQHTLETQFTTTVTQSLPAAIWAFFKRHLVLWVGLLLLALLLAIAAFVRRLLNRERRIEVELASARRELELARRDRQGNAKANGAKANGARANGARANGANSAGSGRTRPARATSSDVGSRQAKPPGAGTGPSSDEGQAQP